MSILIKNGTIYDGSGQPSYQADILIRDNHISQIGSILEKQADGVIDATDSLVLPGFVDLNSDVDHHLDIFTDPYQKSALKQGITTAIGGNEGLSLAPLYNEDSLHFIQSKAAKSLLSLNIDWEEFGEFLNILEKRGVGVNFGSSVGYTTVRNFIANSDNRKLEEKEKEAILKIIKKSIKEGALGISIGFEDIYSHAIRQTEIKEILSQIKNKSLVFVSSMRNPENDPLKSVKEIRTIARKSNLKTHISHIQPIKAKLDEYEELEEIIKKETKKRDFTFDCHPLPVRKISIHSLLPDKIQRKTNREELLEAINNPDEKVEILEYLKTRTRKQIKILHTPKHLNFFEEKYVKEIAKNKGLTQAETLLCLMQESNLEIMCLYYDINEDNLRHLLQSDTLIIVSDGLHLDNSGMNPMLDFINLAQEEKDIPLEKAIAKMTSLPAKKFNIEGRGELKEKNYADIIILKDNQIKDVLVNGTFAIKNKEETNSLTGSIIKNNNG